MTIRAGIVGYGNLGRSVEKLVKLQPDMELVGIFSRRTGLDTDTPVLPAERAAEHAGEIDVLFLCLGSATDIPEQAAGYARHFTTVDTYDNHQLIPRHRAEMDAAAREGGHVAMISTGWDPGLFSLNRVLGAALFPQPQQNMFWGKSLSQGHSDAVRRRPCRCASEGPGGDGGAHRARGRPVPALAHGAGRADPPGRLSRGEASGARHRAGRRRRRPQASSRATAIIAGIATIVVTRIVSFETRRPVS